MEDKEFPIDKDVETADEVYLDLEAQFMYNLLMDRSRTSCTYKMLFISTPYTFKYYKTIKEDK